MEESLLKFGLLDYLEKAKDKTSLPGGGSICALNGALSASLTIMVSRLSEKNLEKAQVEDIIDQMEHAYSHLIENIDKDARAFDLVLQAMRLSKNTEKEMIFREKKIQEGYIHAIEIPLKTMEFCLEVLKNLFFLADRANINTLSDVKIATDLAFAAIKGASFTALQNAKALKDEKKSIFFYNEITTIEDQSRIMTNKIGEMVKIRVE